MYDISDCFQSYLYCFVSKSKCILDMQCTAITLFNCTTVTAPHSSKVAASHGRAVLYNISAT